MTGRQEVQQALFGSVPEQFIEKIGMKGLNWIIRATLDEHYPEDIFPGEKMYGVNWASEHGGSDIDPGVKWIALLRAALDEVPDAQRE